MSSSHYSMLEKMKSVASKEESCRSESRESILEDNDNGTVLTIVNPSRELRCHTRCSLIHVLVSVIILLLVLCLVFIVLYITIPTNSSSNNKGAAATICLTKPCMTCAYYILRSIDSSVEPCEDFYQYSCGGFVKNNYIRDDQSNLNPFVIAQDNVDYSLKELLEKQQLSNYSMDSAIHKALSFYQSCMNERQIEAAGTKPMLDIISKYGSWGITNNTWSNDTWTLEKILARCMVDLSTAAFISLQISPALFNTSEVLVGVGAGSTGLGLGLDDHLLRSITQYQAIFSGYKKLMKTVFTLLGADTSQNSSLDKDIDEILNLETGFHRLKHSLSQQGATLGYQKIVKYTSPEQLNNLTSSQFNWTLYFEEVLLGTNKTLKPNQKMIVYIPNDIKNIINFITSQPKRLLANAIMWNVIHGSVQSLPQAFQEAQNEFMEVVTGVSSPTPRWRTCGRLTNTVFSYAIALLYANEHLSETARKSASGLFIEIRKQFIDGLDEQTWMDNTTRNAARIKLDAMKQDVGYPSFIKNPTKLNKRYENFHVRQVGFFDNLLDIFKGQFQNQIDELDKPPDTSKFPKAPVGVNAFFNPVTNGIAVLMGMFQEPFYESKRLKALNYGGIGMVIGHEITHGFDVSGSQFDEVGNLRVWWTDTSFKNYQKRSDCLIKQYNNTVVFGRKVDGIKTLSENIADNGGLKYAFRAYQKWRDSNGNEERLPGLNFTNDQLFFIGFSQSWCAKYREQNIDKLMSDDSHSLNPVRVRVPLSNFPAFSEAFGCKVPTNTCTVW